MKQHIFRDFFKYTSTNMIAMLGVSLYILADTFFIARALGPVGLTALNFAIVIYSVIQGLGLMIATGGAIDFSMRYSKGSEAGDKPFRHTLLLGAAFGLLCILTGILLPEAISRLLGADAQTLGPTKTYITLILWFAPVFILNNILIAFVRNDQDPGLAMGAMIVSSLSNIVLDYFFMFPLGMGMFGAALATGLSPLISISILLLHYRLRSSRFHLTNGPLETSRLLRILQLGVPSLITELAVSVTLFTFNLVILRLAGNLGVAAYGIIANVAIIATALFTGLAQGIQPLASQYHGKGQGASLRTLLKLSLVFALAMAIGTILVVFAWTTQIAGIFNSQNNQELAAMAESGLKIYFTGFLFAGLNIVMITFLAATLRTRQAILISVLRSSLILIPAVLILSGLFQLKGVWGSFLFTELLVSLLTVLVSWRGSKGKPIARP